MDDNFDFPTTEQYTKADIKKVQKRLLEMAKITASILEQNNFKYIVAFGTLLGAVRHKGFIPWDDDFDMFLFDDEYDAAVECLRKNLPNDIIVHDRKTDPIYWPSWSKLRDIHTIEHTTTYSDDNVYKYRGINIDLYRLKKVNRAEVELYRKQENIEFLVRKHDSKMIDEDTYVHNFKKWTEDYVRLYQNLSIQDVSDDVYAFIFLLKQIDIDDVFPLKRYVFEDTMFYGPNNADRFLSLIYGEYMMPPQFVNRKPHCDRIDGIDKIMQ